MPFLKDFIVILSVSTNYCQQTSFSFSFTFTTTRLIAALRLAVITNTHDTWQTKPDAARNAIHLHYHVTATWIKNLIYTRLALNFFFLPVCTLYFRLPDVEFSLLSDNTIGTLTYALIHTSTLESAHSAFMFKTFNYV